MSSILTMRSALAAGNGAGNGGGSNGGGNGGGGNGGGGNGGNGGGGGGPGARARARAHEELVARVAAGISQQLVRLASAQGVRACSTRGLAPDEVASLAPTRCDRAALRRLPDGCVICHEDFKLDDEICRLACCHTFHATCVARWLAIKASCPLCNVDVRKAWEDEGEGGRR